jgi:hypothetical protein
MLALPQYKSSALFSEIEGLVLEYADAMTQTPVEVPDALFANQLVELTAALAWENYRARFDHAFGVEAEGFTQVTCAMPVRGRQSRRHNTNEERRRWLGRGQAPYSLGSA